VGGGVEREKKEEKREEGRIDDFRSEPILEGKVTYAWNVCLFAKG
jgi:hypothetical protein